MQDALLLLKLFLEAVGVGTDVENVEQRKLIQKAVYLGQHKGLNLGYNHGWYKMGPYSPALTEDYYKLSNEPNQSGSIRLREDILANLEPLKVALDSPPSGLTKPQWSELLCSYHFLRKTAGYTEHRADGELPKPKPLLAPYLQNAKTKLQELGML